MRAERIRAMIRTSINNIPPSGHSWMLLTYINHNENVVDVFRPRNQETVGDKVQQCQDRSKWSEQLEHVQSKK